MAIPWAHARRAAVRAIPLLSVVLLTALPASVSAHAALVSSEPTSGAVVGGPLLVITATFSEPLDAQRSRLTLRDAATETVAEGGVEPGQVDAVIMRIDLLGALPPGDYEVRWTAVTSDDQAVERGTFGFSVEPSPTPSPREVVEPSDAPDATGTPAAPDATGTPDGELPATVPVDGLSAEALWFALGVAAIGAVAIGGAVRRRRGGTP